MHHFSSLKSVIQKIQAYSELKLKFWVFMCTCDTSEKPNRENRKNGIIFIIKIFNYGTELVFVFKVHSFTLKDSASVSWHTNLSQVF